MSNENGSDTNNEMTPGTPKEGGSDKILYVLSYPTFGLLGIILFFWKKDDPDARYHGLNSFIYWVAVGIVSTILGIVTGVLPILGCVILPLFSLVTFVYSVYLAMQAHKGEKPVIPYISDMANKYV